MAIIESIEEKAKRYDKAIERARIWKDKSGMPKDKQGILDDIFPELAESEDENIRKEMLQIAKESEDSFYMAMTPGKRKHLIDWLEKQGKKIKPIEGFNTEFKRQISHIIASTINKEYEYTEDSVKWVSNALLNYAKHEFEKQCTITEEELSIAKKDAFNEALDKIEYSNGELTFTDGWNAAVRFFKKKNICPQKQWKPSEEQIRILELAIDYWKPNDVSVTTPLYNLLEQLKKLREE